MVGCFWASCSGLAGNKASWKSAGCLCSVFCKIRLTRFAIPREWSADVDMVRALPRWHSMVRA
eukprot:8621964-Lingulodinium_polyedra.AAC.1